MKRYIGFWDSIEGQDLTGWAFCIDKPDSYCVVELYLDGQLVTTAQANIFRQDLKENKIGNGDHAFRLAVPQAYCDGKPHTVDVRLKKGPSLHNSPRDIVLELQASTTQGGLPVRLIAEETVLSLFDADFYLATYPDIGEAQVDPLEHYMQTGWQELRDPSATFSTSFYLAAYPDVAAAGINPLEHYVNEGRRAGYITGPAMAAQQLAAKQQAYYAGQLDVGALLLGSGLFDIAHYRTVNPDLASMTDEQLLEHFCVAGWRENRSPNPWFDTAWYLEQYADVRDAGQNPLLHYVLEGDSKDYRPVAWFLPAWYRAQNQLDNYGATMLYHFIAHGRAARLSPNPYFDVQYYLENNTDIEQAGIDPCLHFFQYGFRENRRPSEIFDLAYYQKHHLRNEDINPVIYHLYKGEAQGFATHPPRRPKGQGVHQEIRANSSPSALFETCAPANAKRNKAARAKAIAFYLPQFHPIAENDAWWGEGFTEWRNIARGVPRYAGHYQPRIPRDLGFYELNGTSVMKKQVALAKQMDLHGFCFYYYNFNGHRLLEKPLDAFVKDKSIDFPFSIIWANENWSRRWDGMENDVLIRQDYKMEDAGALIDDLAQYLKHPNYITADGRPVLYIYRADIIPDCANTIKEWRKLFASRHQINPLIVMAQTFGCNDPREFGFDGAIEFPPHKIGSTLEEINPQLEMYDPAFTGSVRRYSDAVEVSLADCTNPFPLIKTAFPMWDNDARKQGAGMNFDGATPALFQQWMEGLVEYANEKPFHGESFVFINAWNEWCEGAYLEPDCHFGYAFLNAMSRALHKRKSMGTRREKVVLIGHDAFTSGAQQLLLNIGKTLQNRFGTEISFVLMGDGDMAPLYEEVAETYIATRHTDFWGSLGQHISALQQRGFRLALTNSLFSGGAAASFADYGFEVCSLIHELPTIVREHHAEHFYEAIRSKSNTVVFPNNFVHDEVTKAFGKPANNTVVRAQGLYKKLEPQADARAKIRKELGLKKTDRLVINIGHGDIRKGIDVFVAVADKVAHTHDDIHFIWLGSQNPGMISWIQRDVTHRGTKNVHFIPFNQEVATYLAASDLFFLTSREDPFPSVVLEALALGLPVAVFDWGGGYVELLKDNKLGFHIPYLDVDAASTLIPQALDNLENSSKARMKYRQELMKNNYDFADYCADMLSLLNPQRKRVSVVVPNYNYAAFLPARLDSIFRQSYPLYEVLVLDDMSKDNSLEVIEHYAAENNRHLRIIPNTQNSGSGYKQWDKGAQLACGEYVWVAEADDLATPDFLSEAVAMLESSKAAFVFCDSKQIDENDIPTGDSYKGYFHTLEAGAFDHDFVMDGAEFVQRFLSVKNIIMNVSGVLWRRDAFLHALAATRAQHETMRVASDWKMYTIAALKSGEVAYLSKAMNTHRRHSQSVTHSRNADQHYAEIAQVQDFVEKEVGLTKPLRAMREAYRKEVRVYLGLDKPEKPASKTAKKSTAKVETPEKKPAPEKAKARGRPAKTAKLSPPKISAKNTKKSVKKQRVKLAATTQNPETGPKKPPLPTKKQAKRA